MISRRQKASFNELSDKSGHAVSYVERQFVKIAFLLVHECN